jgi:hypothetical protein
VSVPFSTRIRASWGILNDSSFINGGTFAGTPADGNNAVLSWPDVACVAPAPRYLGRCGSVSDSLAAHLQNHARLTPVSFRSGTYGGGYTQTGTGFILYLNGQFFVMQMASLPAAGTVWNVRYYTGNVTGLVGSYGYLSADLRPGPVPGLKLVSGYEGTSLDPRVTVDSLLARVHTVPDPYYVTNSLEISGNTKVLRFVNVPAQAIIRIYSTSGILIRILTHNDPQGGGDVTWNLRSRNNQFVASGVYFYHVETPDRKTKVGRFTVVNFAQ